MDAVERSLLLIKSDYLSPDGEHSELQRHGVTCVDPSADAARWPDSLGADPAKRLLIVTSAADLPLIETDVPAAVMADVEPDVARAIFDAHQRHESRGSIYFARHGSVQGVMEACRWFKLLPEEGVFTTDRLGATPVCCDRTFFRVWAPRRKSVEVEWDDGRGRTSRTALQRHASGDFSGTVLGACPGTRYAYVLDNGQPRPDPISHFQPASVHEPSEVISSHRFAWTDQDWQGVAKEDLIIYEAHLGAWTARGTFRGAIERLDELVELGVTAVELMPVAQSPGKWNWGYDGVCLFAPRNSYGRPDDFKALVDACHAAGLAVILDVVYNHLGPEGNYLREFGPYFSRKHGTPWGDAFDFDGPHPQGAARYVIQNALYWLDEYHLDGLRLDAVHFMFDDRPRSIMDEIRTAVSQYQDAALRPIHLIAEANIYDHQLAVGDHQHPPYSAIWCDDMMHTIYRQHVSDLQLTAREYHGARDLAEAIDYGYLYTGPQLQRTTSAERNARHGDQNREYLRSLIVALQTHDSVGNHPHGKRIHQLTSHAFQKAAVTLFMLYPAIPMLFMGEETATEAPFTFFVDFHDRNLRRRVDRGRAQEYPQHQWDGAVSPSDPEAFGRCRLSSVEDHPEMREWYRALIELRREWRQNGWLEPSYLTTAFDEASGCFRLTYSPSEKNQLQVCVRLDTEPAHAVTVPISGHIRLDSHGMAAGQVDSVTLQSKHAVVVQT